MIRIGIPRALLYYRYYPTLGKAGLSARLEAFVDLLARRRKMAGNHR